MSAIQSTNSTISSDFLAKINGTSSSTKSTATATEDAQSRFLTLLVTQLKNQDPLNPMDNAQVTSQLAQISTVDGITQLNKSLQTLLSSAGDSQALQAAALVGKDVLVAGSGISLDAGQAHGGVSLASAADTVKVSIKDSKGAMVKTLDLGSAKAGTTTFAWDGSTDSGTTAANGNYTVSVAATQGGGNVGSTALQLGTVSSVARGSGGVSLNVGNVGSFGVADIKQIL